MPVIRKRHQGDLPASQVFASVFGSGYDTNTFSNACATRLSLGLLNAGIQPRKEFPVKEGRFKGKSVTTSAVNMVNWLRSNFGTPDITVENPITKTAISAKIGNRKGIYAMLPKSTTEFNASGHVTLWHNNSAIGNNDFAAYARVVYFWELK
ncbi:T6SS effector amidase Tae4 family protein [Neisseria sp.]|uniref:T6SS effector amidase Tae4 family protein n=1 Tax=Neisseria sp. TaxID=192066 RepID=UPI0026DD89B2|nr:T6SS effector amidase Tae4 family protein [Neisseria sp.]MDO4908182.1 T6SS effector amidase Tae4 family protein [Neisseria sp.]